MEKLTPTPKKYYDELNIFRALIIIWVTLGHSTDYVAAYPFSGFLKDYAYSFHMCAFFVLSGILIAKKLRAIQSFKDAGKLALNRLERLIVPYLFFSVVSYVLKFFLEKYAFNAITENPVKDVLLGVNNPNGGIWFLHTLFVLSMVGILLCKVPDYITLMIMAGLKIATLFVDIPYFGFAPLGNIYQYGFYFFLGVFLYRYYDGISSFLQPFFQKKRVITFGVSLLALVDTFAVFYVIRIQHAYTPVVRFLLSVAHILVWYLLAHCINLIRPAKKGLMVVGNYGMDIYMLGYYVQTAVRVVFGTILGMPFLFFTSLMFILGLLLPIPISKFIVRKVRVLRMLMLGDFSKSKRQ